MKNIFYEIRVILFDVWNSLYRFFANAFGNSFNESMTTELSTEV